LFLPILCANSAFRPKYLFINKLTKNITLSGRRWKPHGSSKEGRGNKAGIQEIGSKEGTSKEEMMP
jgi:hypothetical protein